MPSPRRETPNATTGDTTAPPWLPAGVHLLTGMGKHGILLAIQIADTHRGAQQFRGKGMMSMRVAHGRVVLVLVLLGLSTLVITGCSALNDVLHPKGTLSGTVQPSEAWPTAKVAVLPQGGAGSVATVSVSPTDGSFQASVEPGTGYAIQVTATGYQTYLSSLQTPPMRYEVNKEEDTPVGTITLLP